MNHNNDANDALTIRYNYSPEHGPVALRGYVDSMREDNDRLKAAAITYRFANNGEIVSYEPESMAELFGFVDALAADHDESDIESIHLVATAEVADE